MLPNVNDISNHSPTLMTDFEIFQFLELLFEKAKNLAGDAIPSELPAWIHCDKYGSHEDDFCYSCAEKIVEWVEGKSEPEETWELDELPDPKTWGKEHIYIEQCSSPDEEDGCVHCSVCGKHLMVSLTEYGVDSEIEHFTTFPGINSPENWAHWASVIEAVIGWNRTPLDKDTRDKVLVVIDYTLESLRQKKIIAECAIPGREDRNKNVFSYQALDSNTGIEVPVVLKFDFSQTIGIAKTFWNSAGKYCCELTLDKPERYKGLKAAIHGVMQESTQKGEQTTVEKFKLLSIGLVEHHADTVILPIEIE